MQWWEVNRYIAGIHRRYHSHYESARLLQWTLACMFRGKDKTPPQSPQDLYKFSWEEKKDDKPAITQEEWDEAQEIMRDMYI